MEAGGGAICPDAYYTAILNDYGAYRARGIVAIGFRYAKTKSQKVAVNVADRHLCILRSGEKGYNCGTKASRGRSMTLLSGAKLDPSKLFAGTLAKKKRPSSVDLTIGKMLDAKGNDLGNECTLFPGEMVFVVSHEVFSLPENVTGLVTCKTSLTHDGVWAITVGLVDPCYVGPVATSLVNFGISAKPLSLGMPFLRVVFFEHEPHVSREPKDADEERIAYHLAAKQMAVRFPPRFLNQDELATKAVEKTWDKMRNGTLFWGAVLAIFFSLLQAGSVAIDRYYFSKDLVLPASEQIAELTQRLERLEAQNVDQDAQ